MPYHLADRTGVSQVLPGLLVVLDIHAHLVLYYKIIKNMKYHPISPSPLLIVQHQRTLLLQVFCLHYPYNGAVILVPLVFVLLTIGLVPDVEVLALDGCHPHQIILFTVHHQALIDQFQPSVHHLLEAVFFLDYPLHVDYQVISCFQHLLTNRFLRHLVATQVVIAIDVLRPCSVDAGCQRTLLLFLKFHDGFVG